MYVVYKHTNKINNKVYIGITSQTPEQRWGANGSNYKSSSHFYSAIQKYGWDNFEHNILFTGLTKDEACSKEQELIKKFNSNNRKYGYNSTSGGEMCKLNIETREKMSQAMRNNKNGLGHKCSEEKKEKIRSAQLGRKFTQEHKDKLSKAAQQRRAPCSEEKKRTLSQRYPNKKPVYCFELNKIFDSVQQCGKELGIPPTNIVKLCNGRGKTLKGYHLSYYNDTINA